MPSQPSGISGCGGTDACLWVCAGGSAQTIACIASTGIIVCLTDEGSQWPHAVRSEGWLKVQGTSHPADHARPCHESVMAGHRPHDLRRTSADSPMRSRMICLSSSTALLTIRYAPAEQALACYQFDGGLGLPNEQHPDVDDDRRTAFRIMPPALWRTEAGQSRHRAVGVAAADTLRERQDRQELTKE
jgi:hypothetical protein